MISKRGFCSRSQAENLVREGRVSLRGKIVRDPETPAFESDEILVDGTPVTASEFVYFAMNKPRGIVTTASDEKGRKTVMDLFREQYSKMFPGKPVPHISPVGRLDAASEGLLLFTNDTQWADALLNPKDSGSGAGMTRAECSRIPGAFSVAASDRCVLWMQSWRIPRAVQKKRDSAFAKSLFLRVPGLEPGAV